MLTFREFVSNMNKDDGNAIKVFFKDLEYSAVVPRYAVYRDRTTGWPRTTGDVSHNESVPNKYTGDVILPFTEDFLEAVKNQGMTTREFLVYLMDLDNSSDLYQKFIEDMQTNTFDLDHVDFTGKIDYEEVPSDLYDSVISSLDEKLSSGDYEVTNV